MAEQTPQPVAPPAPAPPQSAAREGPHFSKDGQLTLDGMRARHRAGYSVMHNGQIIPPGAPLPSEADLAQATGSHDEMERVRQRNEAEIERLRAENAQLRKAQTQPPAPAAPATQPPAPAQPAAKK